MWGDVTESFKSNISRNYYNNTKSELHLFIVFEQIGDYYREEDCPFITNCISSWHWDVNGDKRYFKLKAIVEPENLYSVKYDSHIFEIKEVYQHLENIKG